MTVTTPLIPGLDEIVRDGDPKRRAEAVRRIAELFLQGAAHFRSDHVDLFDGVLINLVAHTEIATRADLAERLSMLGNAPRPWSVNSRARTTSRLQALCCADRRSSTSRP